MAAPAGKRPKATLVKPETVEQTNSFLHALPEKTKENLSLKEAVEKLKEPIQAALAKGYSYADIAKMLSDKGIKISALTLKNYAPSGRRRGGAKPKTTRAKKQDDALATLESDAPDIELADTESPEADELSTPAKPRRGRGKSTAAKTSSSDTTDAKPLRRRTSSAKPGGRSPSSRARKNSASS